MKAVVCTGYGPPEVLRIEGVERPVPKEDEVLIRVRATTVHVGDTRIRRADPFVVRLIFGLLRPKKIPILGMECAGVVEEVGSDVTGFAVGDEVFAFAGFTFGAYAEYICLPGMVRPGKIEKSGVVSKKPLNLGFDEAAAVPAGMLTVLKVFEKLVIEEGMSVLVYGASGSLGTYAVQYAKYLDARVTGVCSGGNLDLVRSIGADHVVDYTTEDFTRIDERFDIIFDAVGKTSKTACKRLLKKDGRFVTANGLGKIKAGDLDSLRKLVEDEKIRPVIDRTYQMNEIVEAHRYVDQGHKKGNVVILIKT